ncbi:MAG: FtsX-like permease family protein [Pseudomonadota bacterium]|nr:MAG: FtsX-like permease family protein [Pseudomonadota bacterium]
MTRYPILAGLRFLQRHPLHLSLSVLAIALGVSVVGAVDLVNGSAMRAFVIASDAVAGTSTHRIVGGPRGVPEEVYRRLRVEHGIRSIAPVVEAYVHLAPEDIAARTVRLLGVDIFAEQAFRGYLASPRLQGNAGALLTDASAAALPTATARALGLAPGQRFAIEINGRQHYMVLAATFDADRALERTALASVLVTDIATAQELLEMEGFLSRIDLVISSETGAADEIVRLLPDGTTLAPASAQRQALEQMTRAFRLNLTALSLLALLVGMFLIYNAMTFSVLQRRQLLGMLRALGVTRAEVYRQVLLEALVLGVVGTLAGLVLAVVLGNALLHLVTRTINDLYFVLSVRELALTPAAFAKAAALGLGATVVAALVPAWEATTTPPRAVMSRIVIEIRQRRRLPLQLTATAACWVAGVVLLSASRDLWISFAALFLIIAGSALLAPAATRASIALLQPVMRRALGVLGAMAARGITVSLSRTGVAMAALSVAVAASVGVGVMIQSFRGSVADWLDNYLRADYFVSSAASGVGASQRLVPGAVLDEVRALPGVETLSLGRMVRLEGTGGFTDLFVLHMPRKSFTAFRLIAGTPEAAARAYFAGDGVLISEPYAYRHRLAVGDAVVLRTDIGDRRFPVAGIYQDYGSDHGVVTMSRATYNKHWMDSGITSFGVYARADAVPEALSASLRAILAHYDGLVLYPNRELREVSLAVFDRTFTVTQVLRLLAILVAFVGILSALMVIQLERAREFAVLRANGMTPAQLWGLVTTETGLMGLVAGALAVPLGVVLAAMLVYVINRRSFGWSMDMYIDPLTLGSALLLALVAALMAGLYPAWRMSRTPAALALREE